MKAKKVTIANILQSEQESYGFGLYGHEVRRPTFWTASEDPYAVVKLIDETVVKLANKQKWDAQKTHEFMNSKLGRWAGDELSDLRLDFPTDKDIAAVLSKYMKRFEVQKRALQT